MLHLVSLNSRYTVALSSTSHSLHEHKFITKAFLTNASIYSLLQPPMSDIPKLTLTPFRGFGPILLSCRNANTHSSLRDVVYH